MPLSLRQLLLRHVVRDDSRPGSQCKHCPNAHFGANSDSAVWKAHFKAIHADIWKAIQAEQKGGAAATPLQDEVDLTSPSELRTSLSSGSSVVSTLKPSEPAKQASIERFTVKAHDQLALLAQLCAVQGIAHRVVETKEFRQLMSALGWSSKLPSRDILKGAIQHRASLMRTQLISTLQNTAVTLASDGWTNVNHEKVTNIVLIARGVAYYWCSIVNTHESNSAEWLCGRIQSIVEELIRTYHLRIAGLVMDNEAVNRKCHRLLTAHYPFLVQIPCAAHTIQLVVQSSLAHQTFAPIVEQTRTLLLFFEAKERRNKLKEVQTLRGDKPLRILRPCATRWSSMLTSVERILRLRDHIELCVTTALLPSIPDRHAFFEDLQLLRRFLYPFRKATDAVQQDSATLLTVYEQFTILLKHVHQQNAQWAAVALLARWKKYVNIGATMATAVLSFQTLPDSVPAAVAHDYIIEFGVEYFHFYTQQSKMSLRDQLVAELAQFVGREGPFSTIVEKKNSLLRTGKSSRMVWNLYVDTKLAQVALVLLSLGASEAAVERTFSAQSLVHSKLRNRLLPPSVQAEMFIRFNNRALDPDASTHPCADAAEAGGCDSDASSEDDMVDWFDEQRYSEEIDASTDEEQQEVEEKEESDDQEMEDAPVEPEARAAAAAAASSRRAVRRAISVPFDTPAEFVQWYIREHRITAAYVWNADARNALQAAASSRCKRGPTTVELEKQIREAAAAASSC
jgi:hypothetical protein